MFAAYASGKRAKLARSPRAETARLRSARVTPVVITKLDRLGGSVRSVIDLVGDLQTAGVGLRDVGPGIDTTPLGLGHVLHRRCYRELEVGMISSGPTDGLACRACSRLGRWSPAEADLGDVGDSPLAR
ncbi:recombinase family protein [Pseudonocardia sp. MCCB 268]|nr:recombinase family protein [Pseudonocardia cytotoxica]